jgi:serine/threonine-protein kinase HipA
LSLGKTKQWYQVTLDHFETWAKKADITWRAIKPHLDDTMAKARNLWPNALNELPMDEAHKEKLQIHWKALQKDFRV